MKLKITILFISLFLISCLNKTTKKNTPINYDFKNLNLYLNSSIENSSSNIEWKWDYMNSNNGIPNKTGIEFYVNHNQPLFLYRNEKTIPSISIKTNNNRIIEFSATVIFHLEKNKKSIKKLLNTNLQKFDLLKTKSIKQAILENGIYKNNNDNFEETIELNISNEKYKYDRMKYNIKLKKTIRNNLRK